MKNNQIKYKVVKSTKVRKGKVIIENGRLVYGKGHKTQMPTGTGKGKQVQIGLCVILERTGNLPKIATCKSQLRLLH